MPLHDIFLGTATASVILAASAAALSGQNHLAVNATVVSPCTISLVDAPEPAESSLCRSSPRRQGSHSLGSGGSCRTTRNFSALIGIDQTVTVYGQIRAGQNVPAGNYSDTIIVTATY